MPGIIGMGTTFNMPNFVGELFGLSREDTPFLSAIGGLTGGKQAFDKEFEWEYYDLRGAQADRQRVEGADAPPAEERVRANASNVLEIHQEAVELSYTKLAVGNRGGYGTSARGVSPVGDEMTWQMAQHIKQVARDVNLTFLTGTYAKPATNATPRRTRGIIQAITSNVTDAASAALTEVMVNDLFQDAYDGGGMREGETRVLMGNSSMKRQLTKIYIRDHNLQPLSANVGGVNLTLIQTDFGQATIMTENDVPDGTLLALSLEEIAPRFLLVPGKGYFFWEPLAKTGAAERSQLYGEIGLEYGNEKKHAKIINATTAY
jgi:hypothetical protein